MKEATGELNMTVIVIVAIAAIAAFFYAFIWPAIKSNITNQQKCASAVCPANCTAATCDCTYIDEEGKSASVTCTNPHEATN